MGEPYYSDGSVTIYHGDCRELLAHEDTTAVDLLLTDPPYGKGEDTAYRKRGRQSRNNYPPIVGDDEPFDPAHLLRFSRVILFGANYFSSRLPDSGSWIVWDRLDGLWGDREQGFNDTADAELAWSNLGGTVRMYRHRWTGFQRKDEPLGLHPTQKPVGLMRWIINKWTDSGDYILDPYMGSGPIAKASKDTGRKYTGIEIEERYCEIAANRCSQEVLDL